ncbi:hypothetical protein RIF29_08985 [Crotalaria pallida]|uniref:Secreted protein n=1 Tax=Crotalaria pallida TaxID=3830 RepID=A0AAN9FUF1_CROPI
MGLILCLVIVYQLCKFPVTDEGSVPTEREGKRREMGPILPCPAFIHQCPNLYKAVALHLLAQLTYQTHTFYLPTLLFLYIIRASPKRSKKK